MTASTPVPDTDPRPGDDDTPPPSPNEGEAIAASGRLGAGTGRFGSAGPSDRSTTGNDSGDTEADPQDIAPGLSDLMRGG